MHLGHQKVGIAAQSEVSPESIHSGHGMMKLSVIFSSSRLLQGVVTRICVAYVRPCRVHISGVKPIILRIRKTLIHEVE
jgi:hypothetical protein